MNSSNAPGEKIKDDGERKPEIVTFYSYKGGTGRTLALANIACLLANKNKGKVLVVDWDLEAPGLHRYFRDKIRLGLLSHDREKAIDQAPGLIDLFWKVEKATAPVEFDTSDRSIKRAEEVFDQIKFEDYILETTIPNLSILKAGRFDERYSNLVNSFDWNRLYKRSEWLIRLFGEKLKKKYNFILIDSRTGITDTSDICTTVLPDKLVVVFTPNRQSLTGIRRLIEVAAEWRSLSSDVRRLLVFPLASRVENSRQLLLETWRFSEGKDGIFGYQRLFEKLFREIYHLDHCDLQDYFNEVKIQHVADYAFGEEIAVLREQKLSGDRFSMTRSFETFCDRLVRQEPPWTESTDSGSSLTEAVGPVYAFLRRIWETQAVRRGFYVAITIGATLAFIAFQSAATTKAVNQAVAEKEHELSTALTLAYSERAGLQQKLDESQKELKTANDLAIKAQTQVTGLSQHIDLLNKSLQEAGDTSKLLQDLKGKLAAAQAHADTAGSQVKTLSAANDDLNKQIGDLGSRLKAQSDENRALRAEISSLKGAGGWQSVAENVQVFGSGKPLPFGRDGLYLTLLQQTESGAIEILVSPDTRGLLSSPRVYLQTRLRAGSSASFVTDILEYKLTLLSIGSGDPTPSAGFSIEQRLVGVTSSK